MRIKTSHWLGIFGGLILLGINIAFLRATRWFKPLIAIAVLAGILQFWIDTLKENKRQQEVEDKFLEFVRSLVENAKSGVPIPKAIIHISSADYGALNPYVKKLAYKIEWGIPLREAFEDMAKDTNNNVIKRSISVVIEAEQSGGNIDDVLQAVTRSVLQVKKIKDERRSNTYSQMVQGYFVFFIFIAIMVVMQVYLMPQLGDITSSVMLGIGGDYSAYLTEGELPSNIMSSLDINSIFVYLVLIQGFFAGLMIGKFSEGEVKMGLKHSLILMVAGYLIITLIRGG